MKVSKWGKTTRSAIPQKNIFFDTETWLYDSETLRRNRNAHKTIMPFRLGYAIYRTFTNNEKMIDHRTVHYIKNPIDFYQFVISHIKSKQRLCLWAHNIAFDLATTYFYYYAFRDKWTSRIPYCKGGVFIDRLSKEGMSIDILDTFNFFKCPLRKLGKIFNFPKGDVDFEKRAGEYIPKQELKPYCLRDVEILERAVSEHFDFLIENDLGNMQKTIASQAFSAYRHRFMDVDVCINANKQPHALERRSYFGGRCECFEIGKIKEPIIYKLDINSMYPSVMQSKEYPIGFSFTQIQCPMSRLKNKLKKYLITADCYVSTNEPVYSKRIKEDNQNKLIFPIGNFWVTLSTPELIYAIEHNHLLKLGQIEAHKKGYIFTDYVDFMYTQRKEYKKQGNEPYSTFVKYLLNSLYGKTAQHQTKTDEKDIEDFMKVSEVIDINERTGIQSTIISFGGREIKRYTTDEKSWNSYIAIAAHVTAYARMFLYELLKKARRENCYYCDTDSLFTNEIGYKNLKDYLSETELGLLKLEDTTTKLIVHGSKDYQWGNDIKLKGVKKNAIEIRRNVYQQDQWTRWHSVFEKGLLTPPSKTKILKVLKRTYNKGTVRSNGRVDPLILNESIDINPFDC